MAVVNDDARAQSEQVLMCHHQRTYCRRRGSDPDPAPATVRKGMREGPAREWRGSHVAMLMGPTRVQTGVAEGARLWSGRRDGAASLAGEWRWWQR